MWVHITSELVDDHPIAVFCYEPDRSTDHLRKFYNDYIGEIICDAYSAYKVFEAENGDKIIICGCWMHARRRWADALRVRDAAGLTREQVDEMPEAKALRLIGEIYKEEGKLKGLTADKRLAGRHGHVKEKVDAYFSFIEELDLDDPSVSERMKDACRYSMNQKEYLCRFLNNGTVPIDNGATERKIRSYGIGRNGWMFCTSPKGAEASAIMYTLVETAKSNGADTYYYLKYLLEKTRVLSVADPGEKYLDSLMPWSEEYRKYEAEQKEAFLNLYLPASDKEPTGKKLLKYAV